MAETNTAAQATEKVQGRRKEVVGEVVSNRMQKTIVVKVTRKKAHPFYGRVVARNKKFYAHDEKNEAHVGDVVRIEETRPLSKLKRWKLKDIVRKAALVPEAASGKLAGGPQEASLRALVRMRDREIDAMAVMMRSMLEVADNSGARKLQMILPLGGSTGLNAGLGDIITAAVKESAPEGQVQKGKVVKAVIVRTRKEHRRRDGTYIRFDQNAAVLINDAGEPVGTRVFGPVARELREKKFLKIVSLAPEVI